jgi:hypothetical protein
MAGHLRTLVARELLDHVAHREMSVMASRLVVPGKWLPPPDFGCDL